MSLYNQIFGYNPLAAALIQMLDLTPEQCGRFRDCFLIEKDGVVVIAIYTRNGGPNREDHEEQTAFLRSHQNYDSDNDDEFDNTYATYYFTIPDRWKGVIRFAVEAKPEIVAKLSPEQRFKKFIEKLKSGEPEDAEVQRALEVGKKIVDAIKSSDEQVKIIKV